MDPYSSRSSLTGCRCLTAAATAAVAPACVEGAGSAVKMAVDGSMWNLVCTLSFWLSVRRREEYSRDRIDMEPNGSEELYTLLAPEFIRDRLGNGDEADLRGYQQRSPPTQSYGERAGACTDCVLSRHSP